MINLHQNAEGHDWGLRKMPCYSARLACMSRIFQEWYDTLGCREAMYCVGK